MRDVAARDERALRDLSGRWVAGSLRAAAGPRVRARIDAVPRRRAARPSYLHLKRAIDVLLALLLLVALVPLFAVIALLIKVDSPGPVFFRQVRLGRRGMPFVILKFRSMYQDAEERVAELRRLNEADGPLFKIRRDPRVTRVGRVLRRFSVDELPQLLNVVEGHMSLIGPRPPLGNEVEQYEDWQRRRLEMRPGITGLWQVNGRSDLPFDLGVRLDLAYIDNCSFLLDLRILAQTVAAVVASRGAY